MGRARLEKRNPITQYSTRKELDRKKIYRKIENELEDMVKKDNIYGKSRRRIRLEGVISWP